MLRQTLYRFPLLYYYPPCIKEKTSNLTYLFMICLCFVLSPICPILLTTYYEHSSEKARKLAKIKDSNLIRTLQESRMKRIQLLKFLQIELGTEVFLQVSIQILILLLASTKTDTTGGLEIIFNQRTFGIDATTVLVLSISWSLKTCIMLHLKNVKTEKGICPITSKIFIFAWGVFASVRRILSIVCMFIPSMGLFSILHHIEYEQIPFQMRLEYAKRFPITRGWKFLPMGLKM